MFHALTHADKGVLYLIKELSLRPGLVAREYILEGKRKQYFNPFTFLVLVLGLSIIMNSLFHPYSRTTQPTRTNTTQQTLSPQEQKRNAVSQRRRMFQSFVEKRANIIAFVAIPLFAFIFWLCFIRSGIAYAEHLVASVFFLGFCFLITALVITPLTAFLPPGRWHSSAQLLLQFIYIAIGYFQFMGPRRPLFLLKTSFVTLLALAFWIGFSGTLVYIYLVYG
ncbi:hypothetical protein GCM10023187_42320 [Nibrella viscosa]|uniref:DUF3667 domain-containing protein n=1 Tax=Nibrella viscosa TaxID=1084524 RepID=A0ABP8KRD3_9BACT